MPLTIMSWNVHRCIGTDLRYDPSRVADIIASMRPDIVVLQEIDSSLRTPTGEDQLSFITRRLGLKCLIGPTLARGYGVYGNAILHHAPLAKSRLIDLSFRKHEPRGAIVAHLELEEGPLRIIGCHLGLKYWERAFQIERLFGVLKEEETPTVLAGDFNEWIRFSPNALKLGRSLFAMDRLSTFPSYWPRLALDRIYLNWQVERTESVTLAPGPARVASDHLPVAAHIEWPPFVTESRRILHAAKTGSADLNAIITAEKGGPDDLMG